MTSAAGRGRDHDLRRAGAGSPGSRPETRRCSACTDRPRDGPAGDRDDQRPRHDAPDVARGRAPASGAAGAATRASVSSQAAIAIATARPLSPSGPTSTRRDDDVDPDGDEGRDDGRRRVLERVEGAREHGDQRVGGEPDEEDRERRRGRVERGRRRRRRTRTGARRRRRESAIPSAVIAIITQASIDEPAHQEPPERLHAAHGRLPRQRRQQDDAQRHADDADRDLEDRRRRS